MKLKLRYSDEEISTLLENQHDYKFDVSTYIESTPNEIYLIGAGEFWEGQWIS